MRNNGCSTKKNNKYWSIVKGLSIIFIVIGHCGPKQLVEFVYLFHLAIFVFVSGYLFNEEKHTDPYIFFGHKLKGNWFKYFGYTTLFILLHNLLLKMGIYSNQEYYGIGTMIELTIKSGLFLHKELISGPLWFVIILVFANTIYCSILYIGKMISNRRLRDIFVILCSLLLGIIGLKFVQTDTQIVMKFQIVLLVIPIVMLGNYSKRIPINKLKNRDIVLAGVVSLGILISIIYFTSYRIELAQNIVGNGVVFYSVSIVGIIFVICNCMILQKSKILSHIFGIVGDYSFEIMALHILFFKLYDYVVIKLFNLNVDISLYPYSFKNNFVIYSVLSICLSILVAVLYNKCRDMIRNRLSIRR